MDTSKFLKALKKFSKIKVLIIGDIVLDEFMYTEIKRISREAPVFICSYQRSDFYPGCGGNTVMNVKSLGANPIPVSVLGYDSEGKTIKDYFIRNKIQTDLVKFTKKAKTNKKTRILAGGVHRAKQHMLRVDVENTLPSISFSERLKRAILDSHGIIFSDYGYNSVSKSVAAKVINYANSLNKHIFVDSRYNLTSFKNATVITPNEEEASNFIGEEIPENGEKLFEVLRRVTILAKAKALLLTRGSKGMVVYKSGDNFYTHIDIYGSDEPVDVSGAGDSVMSAFALSYLSGLNLVESAYIANISGGISVMHKGTYSVKNNEIVEVIKNGKDLPETRVSGSY